MADRDPRDRAHQRVVAILQARMSSRRLPGKVLMPLAGAPSLQRMLERVRRTTELDEIVVATSVEPSDDELHALALSLGLACERGPLADVLERYRGVAEKRDAEVVVRLTGDCPLHDAEVIDEAVRRYRAAPADVEYLSNVDDRTFPRGLDVEVFSREALDRAASRAHTDWDREHVTPFLRREPRAASFTQPHDLHELRWTLDHMDDYEVISAIYDLLFAQEPDFSSADVYRVMLEREDLVRVGDGDWPSEEQRERLASLMRAHLEDRRAVAR